MTVALESICSYRSERVDASDIVADALYVSTESMTPNRGGVSDAASFPESGKVTRFYRGDTLVSNIRPYFKKVWQADCDGYCSNDVLVFEASNGTDKDYLYWLLSSDGFFDYVMATSKGTKMPRGDKAAIMDYAIPPKDRMAQSYIASVLNPLKKKIEVNTKLNGYLA